MSHVVHKRRVFYVSGFDPRGPTIYYGIYAREAPKQAALTGRNVIVGPRQSAQFGGPSSDTQASDRPEPGEVPVATWEIAVQQDRVSTHTHYTFLRWDDIARDYWPRGEARLLGALFSTYWAYLSTGALGRVMRLAWPLAYTITYPAVFLLGMLGLALAVLTASPVALNQAGVAPWFGVPIGWLLAYGVVRGARRIEGRWNCYWILRFVAFTARRAPGAPDLDRRLDTWADALARYVRDSDDDEVLLVGHSAGVELAISVVARALALDPNLGGHRPRVALLTLGECIPLLSFLPAATSFREELRVTASAFDIDWVDFTAPPDGASAALVDPVRASGIDPSRLNRPLVLSARFAKLFTPIGYRELKRDRFRLHFQYLMASEKPGDYDYFAITAGPLTLAERYRGFTSSKPYFERSGE